MPLRAESRIVPQHPSARRQKKEINPKDTDAAHQRGAQLQKMAQALVAGSMHGDGTAWELRPYLEVSITQARDQIDVLKITVPDKRQPAIYRLEDVTTNTALTTLAELMLSLHATFPDELKIKHADIKQEAEKAQAMVQQFRGESRR